MTPKFEDALSFAEITSEAHSWAATVALAVMERLPILDGEDPIDGYFDMYDRLFTGISNRLLNAEPDSTPWITRLAPYFTPESEIDEVVEQSGDREEDPLNLGEYVQLIVRFARNNALSEVIPVEEEIIELSDEE